MNSELIVKDVEFHGDILRAAQDSDGKVWVGVRWVCQGMGFDNERMKNERKKIQRDIVLNEAVHDDDPILSDISEEMRHRIPPNIDPLKKYATYVELIQKNHKTVKY